MKEKMFVGVDVSKAKLNMAFQNCGKIDESEILNTLKAIRGFFRKIEKFAQIEQKEIQVICEATGVYHLLLVKTLNEMEISFSIINPIKIANHRKEIQKRGKTDPADARVILSFSILHNPLPTKIKSLAQNKIVSLLKCLEDLSQTLSASRNRLEAYNSNPFTDKKAIKALHSVCITIKKEMKELEKEIIKQVKETAPEGWKLLKGITGVGNRMAAVTIAFFGDFSEFENSKQVAAFAGLDPVANQSGKYRGKTRISKQGNRYIRKILYMCSLSAMRYNGSCKELYERLLLKGKNKKQARVAVAHKLLRQIFAVAKYQRVWEENYGGHLIEKIA